MFAATFARIVLALSALLFAGLGLAFLLDPVGMAAAVELAPASALAISDVRTVYGGLELAIAIAIALTFRTRDGIGTGLALHNAAWGGLAGGRAWSFAVGGAPGVFAWTLFASELLGLGLGVAAWWGMRGSSEITERGEAP